MNDKNKLHIKQILSVTLLFIFLYSFISYLDLTALHQARIEKDEIKKEKVIKMYEGYKKRFFPKIKSITVKEFLALKKKGNAILVDNRSEKERNVSMIPSAISQKEFERQKENIRNKKIIVYCTVGFRSGKYSQHLFKKGFNAYNLKGGVLLWAHSNQKFTNDNGETIRVHVYGKKWSLLPEGYQAVY